MSDMASTIIAKSDQLNADDLMGGPLTGIVTSVKVLDAKSEQQPVWIYLDAWPQPWKPCKTFRRVLVDVWGQSSAGYVGKSLTLFRNANVMFGGDKVGGIEISHMSGIAEPRIVTVNATRGKKRKITIHPLKVQPSSRDLRDEWAGKLSAAPDVESLKQLGESLKSLKSQLSAADNSSLRTVYSERLATLTQPDRTDLSRPNEVYNAILQRINTGDDATGIKTAIDDAEFAHEITGNEAGELHEALNKR